MKEEEQKNSILYNFEATTTKSALEQISKINFKPDNLNRKKKKKLKTIFIKVKLIDKIDENLNKASFAHYLTTSNSVLITFRNEKEAKLFWKISKANKIYELQICELDDDIILNFCEQFLISEIIGNKTGILLKSQGRRNLNIQDIGNNKRQNLLIIAATKNRDDMVAELLKHDFDVDHKDSDKHNAIEKAWINCMDTSNLDIKNKCFKIILSLLKNNSKYPQKIEIKNNNGIIIRNYEFNSENCSEEIENFVKFSENLHDLITESNLEDLKLELEKEPKLCHFYDKNNKSLMSHAIESKDLNIWKLLVSLNLSIGQHEIENLKDIYEKYKRNEKRLLSLMRSQHQKMSKELPSSHVYFLLTRCRIGGNDRRSDERWNLVEEAFKIMDTDKSCSKVLQIAAKWKQFTIYFDFKHDTAYYLDPAASSFGTKGIIYGANTIYIGAKFLSDDQQKHKVISTIIHELCHLAVYVTYFNSFDPYPKGESEAKTKFKVEVVPECEENGDLEEIVGNVGWYYDEKDHDSEYIVRVVQMLMHYYVQNPSIECENSKFLKDRKEKFEKLFKYYEEVVEKNFDDFLKIIDTLRDENVKIGFSQLTIPMKARILHSNVNFQGQKTILHEIIDNSANILSKLTSKQIQDMLINRKLINIGKQHKVTTKLSSIERQFKVPATYAYKTMAEVQTETETSKMFILSDSAGAGKTVTFKELTEKLKKANKNFWVCFIKLRDHREIFDSSAICKDSNIEDVLNLLIKIQDFKDESVAEEIFKHLFYNDRVIMLLDGVDEISPNYNELMSHVLKILKENTKNQFWISSRPQCAGKLEAIFCINAHKLEPYTIEERDVFIGEIFDNFHDNFKEKPSNDAKAATLINLKDFFESLDKDRDNNSNYQYEVNNPLMIKMITELYIQGQIDLNPESANLFDIFHKVTSKVRKEVSKKVDSDDNDAFRDFNLGHVHQVLILKNLFVYNEIKNLSIMETWKEERTNWTVDRIQRFGFVTLDSRFDKDPRGKYIDFIHRTYADFFMAQLIISIVFDTKIKNLKDNKDFKIFFDLINQLNISGDSSIAKFLLSFMHSNKSKKIHSNLNIEYLCEKFRSSIRLRHHHMIEKVYDVFNLPQMQLILILLSNNPKINESIWKLKESPNFLEYTLFDTKFNNIENICGLLQISFGSDWYVKFNKKEKKFRFKNYDVKLNIKDQLHFIEFIENNYNIIEKSTIYDNVSIFSTFQEMPETTWKEVLIAIFKRFVEISNDEEEEAFLKIMNKFTWYYGACINLEFWKEQCDTFLENCDQNNVSFLKKFKHHVVLQILNKTEKDLSNLLKLKKKEKIWFDNEEYKIEVRKNLNQTKIDLSSFLEYSFEEIKELSELLVEIFEPNMEELLMIFTFYENNDIVLHEEKFNQFLIFMSQLNDAELIIKFHEKIFHSNLVGNLLSEKTKLSKESFVRILNLILLDVKNYKNIQEHLFSGGLFSEPNISIILSNLNEELYPEFMKFLLKIFETDRILLARYVFHNRIYKPIEKHETFKIFVKFLNEIFEKNRPITILCVKLNIEQYFSKTFHSFNSPNEKASVARVYDILIIYGHYSKDFYNELCKPLMDKNIFLHMIADLPDESCENFINICMKIFSRVKPHPNNFCMRCYNHSVLIFLKNKGKLKALEKFLKNLYNGNEEHTKCVKQNLIYDNFDYLICHSTQDRKLLINLIKFINKNNCLIDQLREIYSSQKLTVKIFYYTPVENRDNVTKFLSQLFASDKQKIIESIGIPNFFFATNFYKMKDNEEYSTFKDFLIKIVGHDCQDLVDKCFIKIFRDVYGTSEMNSSNEIVQKVENDCECIQSDSLLKPKEIINEIYDTFLCKRHSPILSFFYYENAKEIAILENLIENFSNHWEWAQDLFLDKFPFECIQRMSNKNYEVFENFLKLVFKANKVKLREGFQKKYFNDEILSNECENFTKFVKTFKIDTNN